jgi:O-antigen ligase
MVAVSALALWQLATGQGRIDVEGVWRVRALYGSPNNLALVLDRVVPLALALAAFGTSLIPPAPFSPLRERRRGGVSPLPSQGRGAGGNRFVLAFIALLTAAACLATFSKGALLLGLPVGIGIVLLGGAWRSRRRWPLWALAGLVVACGAILLVLFRTPRFADLLNFQTGTSFFRVRLWQAAWQMGLDHPWLGMGPDNFLYAYRTRYVLPSAWQELNLSHPHNLLLDLWTRLGVIGVLAGGWALVAAFRRAWHLFTSVSFDCVRQTTPDSAQDACPGVGETGDAAIWPLALGLLAGLAATVAHGLIDNSLFLVDLMALFMLTLGILQRLGTQRSA